MPYRGLMGSAKTVIRYCEIVVNLFGPRITVAEIIGEVGRRPMRRKGL